MLDFFIPLFCFITLFLVFSLILSALFRDRDIVERRLEHIAKNSEKDRQGQLEAPFISRVIRPVIDSISKMVLRITPGEIVLNFEKKILAAGKPFNLTLKEWLNIQAVLTIAVPLASIALLSYLKLDVRRLVVIVLAQICLGMLLPNMIISRKMNERQRKITNSLPDIMDLLTVSVEAGLGFDAALSRVSEKMPGPLASEFDDTLQEIKLGKLKKDALKDMAGRVNIPDLTTLINSIIQADQFGIGIGSVLRIQSEQVREKRRQRAREKALKAPVKMLVPMVFFIFPSIFSVLLGPIALKLISIFSNNGF